MVEQNFRPGQQQPLGAPAQLPARETALRDVVLPQQEYAWWQSKAHREAKLLEQLQKERVLSSIHSKPARDLVSAAYAEANRNRDRRVRWIRSGTDYLEKADSAGGDAYAYRNWIYLQLLKSDIARLLPGGRETLPDIYEAMAEPWRSLERLFEPRSNKQLVSHVIRHLDWYLDPTQRVKPPIWQVSLALAILLVVVILLALSHFGIRVYGYMWIWIAKGLAGGFTIAAARLWGAQKVGSRKVHGFYRLRGLIHAAELYYYLSETYVEPEEEEVAAGMATA